MHHRRIVVATTMDVQIFVLAEAPEVEGLAVDQELRAVDPDGADADRQRVAVDHDVAVEQIDLQLVEVPAPGPPQLRIRHAKYPLGPVALQRSMPSASRSRARTMAAPASIVTAE